MFWMITGLMLAAAALVVAVPLYRSEKKLSATSISSVIVIVGVAAALYTQIGSPNLEQPHAGADVPGLDEMVVGLANRLKENPDDLDGWKMLGRSYLQMGNYPGAIAALERAVEMESSENGQTLADLGEAVFLSDNQAITSRSAQLFENAVAVTPNNPKALFYAGMAAVQRGDHELAADRWEALLATSPPPNVQEILRARIAELRGEAPMVAPPPTTPAEASQSVVDISVSLGDAAANAGLPNATVFIIVRDPNAPAPPIAAARRQVSDLPAVVSISDSDAMIAGRVPSAFQTLEVIARVSLSGQPTAQTGDWFGQQLIEPASTNSAQIVIDQQVP